MENIKKVQAYACCTCGSNCWNCFYADSCGDWLDDGSGVPMVWVDPKTAESYYQKSKNS